MSQNLLINSNRRVRNPDLLTTLPLTNDDIRQDGNMALGEGRCESETEIRSGTSRDLHADLGLCAEFNRVSTL